MNREEACEVWESLNREEKIELEHLQTARWDGSLWHPHAVHELQHKGLVQKVGRFWMLSPKGLEVLDGALIASLM